MIQWDKEKIGPAAVAAATLSLLTSLGCGHSELTNETRGFRSETAAGGAGQGLHYIVFVPHASTVNAKPPVIMFLNGWGQNGNDGLRQVSNNFGQDIWRRRDQMPFLAVCPQCSKDGYWAPGNSDAEFALACKAGSSGSALAANSSSNSPACSRRHD